ncbi:MAG: hypothetical protein ACYC6G_14335 [Desulfobaccales bacterium]
MEPEDAIKAAKEAIGSGKTDDYGIAPTKHAEEFIDKAPTLSDILSSSEVRINAQRYEEEDLNATDAQRQFNKIFIRANIAVLITGVFVALVLVSGVLGKYLSEENLKILLAVLSLGGVIAGVIASKDLYVIRQGGLLEAWMSKRAFAETARLDYFDTLVRFPIPATDISSPPIALLKLEYFRRFQLDVQRAYYRERGKDHKQEAVKILSLSGWAMAGAAIATGAAGVLSGAIDTRFAALAGLGTIFTNLSSYTSMKEAVNQNRRNAERYARTLRVLEDLYKKLDEVRKAVYAAGLMPLFDFVEAVHEQLSLEHRQWLSEMGEGKGAFAKLESTLKEIQSKGKS